MTRLGCFSRIDQPATIGRWLIIQSGKRSSSPEELRGYGFTCLDLDRVDAVTELKHVDLIALAVPIEVQPRATRDARDARTT